MDIEFKAKVVDIMGPDYIVDALTQEVAMYAALNKLQEKALELIPPCGHIFPTLFQ